MAFSYTTLFWSVISALCGIVFYYYVKLAATSKTNNYLYVLAAAATMPISLYSIYTLLSDKKNSIVFVALLIRGLNIGVLHLMDIFIFEGTFKWIKIVGILLALFGAYLTE